MFCRVALITFSLLAVALGQQVGTQTAESHPALSWQTCKAGGTCTTQSSGSVVLDANWRWTHATSSTTNCYTGNQWDATLCPDGATCAANCALDGADYEGTYGISSSGNALTLKFVTNSAQENIGSRVYLMASEAEYQMFKPLNQEFTFTVDVSQLPCGLNGALYFSEMDADGGVSRFPTNKAGAKYGTGYCDSQCPRDIKFINGVANVANWTSTNQNSGTGSLGTCCGEMDIWEANSMATAYTPHPCSVSGQTECTGTQCGGDFGRYAGVCDPDGCDFNSFRMGDKTFFGKGMTVDTSSPITVVTQFLTSDNTTSGTLSEIRRLYVQNGQVIQNSKVNIPGMDAYDSVTDAFCDAQKSAFGDTTSFQNQGGLAAMGKAFQKGVVLVLSIWDDYAANMLWLDSDYPTTSDPTKPGVARGTCATNSGVPATVEAQSPNAQVIYSNIKFGDIGSTFSANGTTSPPPTNPTNPPSNPTNPPSNPGSGSQSKYGQCGGIGWTGPTTCVSGSTCTYSNPYYSQCL